MIKTGKKKESELGKGKANKRMSELEKERESKKTANVQITCFLHTRGFTKQYINFKLPHPNYKPFFRYTFMYVPEIYLYIYGHTLTHPQRRTLIHICDRFNRHIYFRLFPLFIYQRSLLKLQLKPF